MLARLLHLPADIEVGVAIPIGCMLPLAVAAAVLVGTGVLIGSHQGGSSSPDHVVVRVINDGAAGGPKIVATQVVPLR